VARFAVVQRPGQASNYHFLLMQTIRTSDK